MTKQIKKVGVPTQIKRQFKEGVDEIQCLFNGREITLKRGVNNYTFESDNATDEQQVNVFLGREQLTNGGVMDYDIFNKSLAKQIKSLKVGETLTKEIDDVILTFTNNGVITCIMSSRYDYVFIANDNDYTLESID